MAWRLGDAEERAAEAPDTFEIPSAEERAAIAPGVAAKLLFEAEDFGTERMWVEVLGSDEHGSYRGKLLNEPAELPGLAPGDEVRFEPHHVAAIMRPPELIGYDEGESAVVGRRVMARDAPPGFVTYYGDPPRWYVFVGDETEEERDSSELEWIGLAYLAGKWPQLDHVFPHPEPGRQWLLAPDGTYRLAPQ